MNGVLRLKEKTTDRVVYYYSCDTALFSDMESVVIDGEIEYSLKADSIKVVKKATYDEDGGQAKFLSSHMRRIILKEGCPEKRFIAIG